MPANLLVLKVVLESSCELVCARSGREAIATLERDKDIDVILMDVQMPEMDGYEVTTRIKKMPGCEDIPLVFITAVYTEDPQIRRGYEVGGVDYFTKPFDPDLLRLKVGVYASFRRRETLVKVREKQLEESEAVLRASRKLTSVLESLPVGVIIADVAGRACQTNEPLLRIIGSVDAIQRGAYGDVLAWWERNADTLRHVRSPLSRALAAGESSHNEVVRIECLDGAWKNVHESTSPLLGLDGAVVGAVVVLQDVTERRKFEADLEERISRLVSVGMELEDLTRVKR
jgi:PAS domain S-box-containing protein